MKEQQKQHLINIMKSDEELGLYDETLEEAAKNHSNQTIRDNSEKSFIEGAKWHEKKQDDFAIGFGEWCIKKRIDFFDSTAIGETYTINGFVSKYKMSELLEMFKKEKGL